MLRKLIKKRLIVSLCSFGATSLLLFSSLVNNSHILNSNNSINEKKDLKKFETPFFDKSFLNFLAQLKNNNYKMKTTKEAYNEIIKLISAHSGDSSYIATSLYDDILLNGLALPYKHNVMYPLNKKVNKTIDDKDYLKLFKSSYLKSYVNDKNLQDIFKDDYKNKKTKKFSYLNDTIFKRINNANIKNTDVSNGTNKFDSSLYKPLSIKIINFENDFSKIENIDNDKYYSVPGNLVTPFLLKLKAPSFISHRNDLAHYNPDTAYKSMGLIEKNPILNLNGECENRYWKNSISNQGLTHDFSETNDSTFNSKKYRLNGLHWWGHKGHGDVSVNRGDHEDDTSRWLVHKTSTGYVVDALSNKLSETMITKFDGQPYKQKQVNSRPLKLWDDNSSIQKRIHTLFNNSNHNIAKPSTFLTVKAFKKLVGFKGGIGRVYDSGIEYAVNFSNEVNQNTKISKTQSSSPMNVYDNVDKSKSPNMWKAIKPTSSEKRLINKDITKIDSSIIKSVTKNYFDKNKDISKYNTNGFEALSKILMKERYLWLSSESSNNTKSERWKFLFKYIINKSSSDAPMPKTMFKRKEEEMHDSRFNSAYTSLSSKVGLTALPIITNLYSPYDLFSNAVNDINNPKKWEKGLNLKLLSNLNNQKASKDSTVIDSYFKNKFSTKYIDVVLDLASKNRIKNFNKNCSKIRVSYHIRFMGKVLPNIFTTIYKFQKHLSNNHEKTTSTFSIPTDLASFETKIKEFIDITDKPQEEIIGSVYDWATKRKQERNGSISYNNYWHMLNPFGGVSEDQRKQGLTFDDRDLYDWKIQDGVLHKQQFVDFLFTPNYAATLRFYSWMHHQGIMMKFCLADSNHKKQSTAMKDDLDMVSVSTHAYQKWSQDDKRAKWKEQYNYDVNQYLCSEIELLFGISKENPIYDASKEIWNYDHIHVELHPYELPHLYGETDVYKLPDLFFHKGNASAGTGYNYILPQITKNQIQKYLKSLDTSSFLQFLDNTSWTKPEMNITAPDKIKNFFNNFQFRYSYDDHKYYDLFKNSGSANKEFNSHTPPQFLYNKRHFYVKLKFHSKQFILSQHLSESELDSILKKDLTVHSRVQDIKADIDASFLHNNIHTSITGTIGTGAGVNLAAKIKSTTTGADAIKMQEYLSVLNIQYQTSIGGQWTTGTTIHAKFISNKLNTKYIINDNSHYKWKDDSPDVSRAVDDFSAVYSYIDISIEKEALNKIKLTGFFEWKNGMTIHLPRELYSDTLKAKRLSLQMLYRWKGNVFNGGKYGWQDVDHLDDGVDANTKLVSMFYLKSTGDRTCAFRLVPTRKDYDPSSKRKEVSDPFADQSFEITDYVNETKTKIDDSNNLKRITPELWDPSKQSGHKVKFLMPDLSKDDEIMQGFNLSGISKSHLSNGNINLNFTPKKTFSQLNPLFSRTDWNIPSGKQVFALTFSITIKGVRYWLEKSDYEEFVNKAINPMKWWTDQGEFKNIHFYWDGSKSHLEDVLNQVNYDDIQVRWGLWATSSPSIVIPTQKRTIPSSKNTIKKYLITNKIRDKLASVSLTGTSHNLNITNLKKIWKEFSIKEQLNLTLKTSYSDSTSKSTTYNMSDLCNDSNKKLKLGYDKSILFKFNVKNSAKHKVNNTPFAWINTSSKKSISREIIAIDINSLVDFDNSSTTANIINKNKYFYIDKYSGRIKITNDPSMQESRIKIYFSISKEYFHNLSPMPLSIFNEYVSGTLTRNEVFNGSSYLYGFTSSMFDSKDKLTDLSKVSLDGKWGYSNIELSYHISTAADNPWIMDENKHYKIDKNHKINRFISSKKFENIINKKSASGNYIKSDFLYLDKTLTREWDTTTGTWSEKYVFNSHNLEWGLNLNKLNLADLNSHIIYKIDSKPTHETLPTAITDNKSERKIEYKIEAKSNFETGERAVFSEQNYVLIHYITNQFKQMDTRIEDAKINNIPAPVIKSNDILNPSLSPFTPTKWYEYKYSLTSFKKPSNFATDSFCLRMGITSLNEWTNLHLSASMSWDELKTALNAIKNATGNITKKIWRKDFSYRVVPTAGYSFSYSKSHELFNLPPDTSGLFTTNSVSILKDSIMSDLGITGTKSIIKGIHFHLSTNNLKALDAQGLKLQFTRDSTDKKGIELSPAAYWVDFQGKPITVDKASYKHGMKITLTPGTEKTFLAFRIVPIKDETGSSIILDENKKILPIEQDELAATNKKTIYYKNMTHINLTHYYKSIDCESIPTLVKINNSHLNGWTEGSNKHAGVDVSGTTKSISINENDGLKDDINKNNTTAHIADKFEIQYSFDNIDSGLWLNKTEFKNYLSGDKYTLSSDKKNVKDSSGKIIKGFTKEIIDRHTLWKANSFVSPNYKMVDIHKLYMKWVSLNPRKYISSDSSNPVFYTIKNSSQTTFSACFRKWIDGEKINEYLRHYFVSGNTQSFRIYFENQNKKWINNLQNSSKFNDDEFKSWLNINGLKIQYLAGKTPNAGNTSFFKDWVNDSTNCDFPASATLTEINNRKVFMRVIPKPKTISFNIPVTDQDTQDLFIQYNSSKYAQISTNDKLASSVRKFKVYIKLELNKLSKFKQLLSGNTIILPNIESVDNTIDSNNKSGKQYFYDKVHILYKYGQNSHGEDVWITFSQLKAKLAELRTNYDKGTKITLPDNFSYSSYYVKWVLNNYKDAELDPSFSTPVEIKKGSVKNWVDCPLQKRKVYKNPGTWTGSSKEIESTTIKCSEFVANTSIDISGSMHKIAFSNSKIHKYLVDNASILKLQYTNKKEPSSSLSSADWNDVTPPSGDSSIFADNLSARPDKALFVRFVPKNAISTILSTQDSQTWGIAPADQKEERIYPVRIDLSTLKQLIDITSTDKGKSVFDVPNPTTSSEVTTQEWQDNSKSFLLSGKYEGIKYEKATDSGATELITDPAERESWLRSVGLIIQYRVKQTVTQPFQDYWKNNYYSFSKGQQTQWMTLSALQHFTSSGILNFKVETMEWKWGIDKLHFSSFAVNDGTAKKLTKATKSKIRNILYTRDYTTLTDAAVTSSGNNLKFNLSIPAGSKLSESNLNPEGYQLKYAVVSKSGNNSIPQWSTAIPKSYRTNQEIRIQLFALPDSTSDGWTKKYKIGDKNPQVLTLNLNHIYKAIVWSSSNISAFNNFKVSENCTTYKPHFDSTPIVASSLDGKTHGYINWKVDSKDIKKGGAGTWKRTLLGSDGAVSTTYHGVSKNFYSLDKDRYNLWIRYTTDTKWIFTDMKGKRIDLSTLQKQVVLSKKVVQPILINEKTDFTKVINSSWKEMAENAKFRPIFNPHPNSTKTADFAGVNYKGKDQDSKGHSVYQLDKDPYSDNYYKKDKWQSLSLPHTHLEFSSSESKTPSLWYKNIDEKLKNLTISTSEKHFFMRLVANEGYKLSNVSSSGIISDVSWKKAYTIILTCNTTDFKLKNIDYTGFSLPASEKAKGIGQIIVRQEKEDHSGDADVSILNEKTLMTKASRIWVSCFVEYNVLSENDSEIPWCDTNSPDAKAGWHEYNSEPNNWYGYIPKNLKTGQKVEVRLKVRNGWLIVDAKNTHKLPSGFTKVSHVLGSSTVPKCPLKINLPDKFKISSSKKTDIYGRAKEIKVGDEMVSFSGAEGLGQIIFDKTKLKDLENKVDVQVQVFKPIGTVQGAYIDENGCPDIGYQMLVKNIADPSSRTQRYSEQVAATVSKGSRKRLKWLKNNDQMNGILNSWWGIEELNSHPSLEVGDAVRFRFKAKTGYRFKYVKHPWDKDAHKKDLFYPKIYSEHSFPSVENDTLPISVFGLKVKPNFTASQVQLELSDDVSKRVTGNAWYSVSKAQMPTANEKWHWEFETSTNSGSSWTSWKKDIAHNLNNNDLIKIKAFTNSPLYKFASDYSNLPKTYTIQGLKQNYSLAGDVAPLNIEFDGHVADGHISKITNTDKPGQIKTMTTSSGKTYFIPNLKIHNLHYEFQTSKTNPASWTSKKTKEYKTKHWKNDSPDSDGKFSFMPLNLVSGTFVRLRIMPNDSSKIALKPTGTGDSSDYVYSQVKTPIGGKSDPYGKGWVKVNNLVINADNVKLSPGISGYIKQSSIYVNKGKSISDANIDIYCSLDNLNWYSLSNQSSIIAKTFSKLTNNDTYSLRIRSNAETRIDIKDHNAKRDKNGDWYIQKPEWKDIKVTGLKKLLYVKNMTLSTLQLSKDPKHSIAGEAELITPTISHQDTIVDRTLNSHDDKGKSYASMVRIRYRVRRVDPDTGALEREKITYEIPSRLSNGDSVTAELYTDENGDHKSEYSFNKTIEQSIQIEGLSTILGDVPKIDILFSGTEGHGVIFSNTHAPNKTVLAYKISYKKDANGNWLPDDNLKWTDVAANDLWNGQYVRMAITKLNVTRKKIGDKTFWIKNYTPVQDKNHKKAQTEWTRVSGLKNNINLDGIRVKLINEANPWVPKDSVDKNIAFKILGKQQYGAKIVLNHDISKLRDITGNQIPQAEKLTWNFSILDEIDKGSSVNIKDLKWQQSLPSELKNGQRVYATLVAKNTEEYKNYQVINFDPIFFDIHDLKEAIGISNKTTLMALVIGGVVVIGGLVAGLMIMFKFRRKFKL